MNFVVAFVLIALTLLVLGFAFGLGDSGLAGKIVKAFQGKTDQFIKDYDQEAYRGELVKVPEEHQQAILRLNETIYQMLSSSRKDCFANYAPVSLESSPYSGLPPLLGKGTSIVMLYDSGEDATNVRVYGGAGGEQLVTTLLFSIPHMHPCVIAGNAEITNNFYTKFLMKQPVSGSYHAGVNQIQLKDDDGNALRTVGFGEKVINDQEGNLLDGGWLFTPDNRHICFFPTSSSTNEHGLDVELVSSLEENSIRLKMAAGVAGGLVSC